MSNIPNRVEQILRELNPGEAEALLDCLVNPKDSGRRIAGVLTKWGHPISKSTVNIARQVLAPKELAA